MYSHAIAHFWKIFGCLGSEVVAARDQR